MPVKRVCECGYGFFMQRSLIEIVGIKQCADRVGGLRAHSRRRISQKRSDGFNRAGHLRSEQRAPLQRSEERNRRSAFAPAKSIQNQRDGLGAVGAGVDVEQSLDRREQRVIPIY